MTNPEADILIIGGGIAGCIAAISLADTHRVCLIDKLSEPLERIGESLAPAAQRILKKLDLLEGMEYNNNLHQQQLYLNNSGMQSYWGSGQVYIVDHLRNPDGFGRNLNRKAFEIYLRESAMKRGVSCLWPVKLQSSSYEDLRWQITVQSENKGSLPKTFNICARFIIDASGRQARFAKSIGIRRHHEDKLISCWATLPDTKQNKMGIISAGESGWWYSASLPNDKRIISFQTDPDLIEKSVARDPNVFLNLAQSNREIAQLLEKNSEPITFHGVVAANSTCLEKVAGQQWAALGDAAISFDPLSSQGMFHAMASAMQLKELIVKSDNMDNNKTKGLETAYAAQMHEIWKHYLKHKAIIYRNEMRWKDSPFWKRRH